MEGVELYIPLKDLCVIIPCFVLAIYYRKKPLYHARFIIGSSIQLIEPALVRTFMNFLPESMGMGRYLLTLAIVDGIIVYLIYKDRNQKKGRWIFYLVLGMVLTIQVLLFAGIHKLDFFVDMMHWFMDLNIT